MNEPIDHHYMPVFYISRWVGSDGRVCRFSRPYGDQVKAKRVAPKGTGFEPRLYQSSGHLPENTRSMERDFMAKLDAGAADALTLLESGLPDKEWTSKQRSSWSRFVLTQLLRTPEDIAQLKSSVAQEWGSAMHEIEQTYAVEQSESSPLAFREYLVQQDRENLDEFAFSVAQVLMGHSDICHLFNDMHWLILEVPNDEIPLLTSDRPIWMTDTLTEDDAFITMPIGPRKLFAAAVQSVTHQKLEARRRRHLVKAVNKLVVQHAVKYVYGLNDDMAPFIQKHMSTRRHSTLLERLATSRGHKIVAPDSPLAKASNEPGG